MYKYKEGTSRGGSPISSNYVKAYDIGMQKALTVRASLTLKLSELKGVFREEAID